MRHPLWGRGHSDMALLPDQFLSHIDTARDFLEIHLPATLRAVCDLDTLRLESGSFIEDNLRAHYSDILYSLKTARGDGYVYCVIEHQSSPDKMIAFRLMRYSISAMQRHLEQGHEKLPLVIPVLFYHGKIQPYPWSTNWLDCFDAPALAKEIYSGTFGYLLHPTFNAVMSISTRHHQ